MFSWPPSTSVARRHLHRLHPELAPGLKAMEARLKAETAAKKRAAEGEAGGYPVASRKNRLTLFAF
jgi:hypothetical protein